MLKAMKTKKTPQLVVLDFRQREPVDPNLTFGDTCTVTQTAEYLGVSRNRVHQLLLAGKLQGYCLRESGDRSLVLVSRKSILELLQKRRQREKARLKRLQSQESDPKAPQTKGV